MASTRVEAVSLGQSSQSVGYAIVFANTEQYIVRESESFIQTEDDTSHFNRLQWLQRTQQYHQEIDQVLDVTGMDDEITSLIREYNPSAVPLAVGSEPRVQKTDSGILVIPRDHLYNLVQRLHEQERIRIPRHQFETREWLHERIAEANDGVSSWRDDGRMTALALACWYCWYQQYQEP